MEVFENDPFSEEGKLEMGKNKPEKKLHHFFQFLIFGNLGALKWCSLTPHCNGSGPFSGQRKMETREQKEPERKTATFFMFWALRCLKMVFPQDVTEFFPFRVCGHREWRIRRFCIVKVIK